MKNKLLKLSLSVPVALSLFFAQSALASIPNSPGLKLSFGNYVGGSTPMSLYGYAIDSGPVNGLDISLYTNGGAGSWTWELKDQGGTILASTTYSGSCSAGCNLTLPWDTPVNLDVVQRYELVRIINSGPGVLNDGDRAYALIQTPLSLPVLSFKYPYDQTSIGNDFSSFQITASSTDANQSAGVSLEIIYARNPNFLNAITLSDNQTHLLGAGTSTVYYIQKPQALYSNSTYYAKVLNLGTNTSSTISWSTGQLTGTLNTNPPVSSIEVSTSTLGVLDVNSSSSPFYVDCSAYENVGFFSSGTIGGIFCNVKKTGYSIAQWLLVPPQFAQDYWQGALNNIKQVPPFNVVWGVVQSFEAQAQNASSTGANYADLNLDIPEAHINTQLLSADMVKNWLTTSHCNSACAQERKDTYFSWVSAIIWLGAGLKILTFIF